MERVASKIYIIRGKKVMLDADLADLYNVSTSALNQAVKRNMDRFPGDFMFQLTATEAAAVLSSRSQNVTLKQGQNIKYLPSVFTEHGVAMLSSVLKSTRAVHMSILIVRVFVRMRELMASNKDLAERVQKLEHSQQQHASVLALLADEIDKLSEPPPAPAKEQQFGFRSREGK